jgi:hypothetical protein
MQGVHVGSVGALVGLGPARPEDDLPRRVRLTDSAEYGQIVMRDGIEQQIRDHTLARQRANLANLDATIKLFSPGTNPDAIPPKRPYRRTRYFARNELSRLTQDALRTASGPLTSAEIAAAVMQPKGMLPCCAVSRSGVPWRSPGRAGMQNGRYAELIVDNCLK